MVDPARLWNTSAQWLLVWSQRGTAVAPDLPVVSGIRMLWAKRGFDLLLSGLGLLVSAPLWALIALSIKVDDGGPVFYAQERVGKGGGDSGAASSAR